ncbi:hypothetical protein [Mycoplana sp. BE70]|uniref:hypothetical protein n=1 Tax=Mycoplana sp. BE70 TaxID=2817775 RepID=UPI00286BA2DF|nr:hypothetical protein [Mycoplana sp. BE70]
MGLAAVLLQIEVARDSAAELGTTICINLPVWSERAEPSLPLHRILHCRGQMKKPGWESQPG